jgi:hypothetical protein
MVIFIMARITAGVKENSTPTILLVSMLFSVIFFFLAGAHAVFSYEKFFYHIRKKGSSSAQGKTTTTEYPARALPHLSESAQGK